MRITHWIIPIAAGAAIFSPLAAQDMAEPAGAPEMTAEQIAEMGGWSAGKQAEFGTWPAEVQAYYWTLAPERQEVFWRLAANDRAAIAGMDEEARTAAWAMIDEKLQAMSSAPTAPKAPPSQDTSPPAPDEAQGRAPEETDGS